MSRIRIGRIFGKLASIFDGPSRGKQVRRFRPTLESLEARLNPTPIDYWQPGVGSNLLWSNAANWSLGRVPNGGAFGDAAVFDSVHANGFKDCTIDVAATCYGIDFEHTWSKNLTINSGKSLECYSYFDAQGTATADIYAVDSTATITVDANNLNNTTIDGCFFASGKGTFKDLSLATSELQNPNYTDWNMQFGDSTNNSGTVNVKHSSAAAGFLLGKNQNVTFDVWNNMTWVGSGVNDDLSNGTSGNTYINIHSTSITQTDTNGLSVRIDSPVVNQGTLNVRGTLYLMGSNTASDLKDTISGQYEHLANLKLIAMSNFLSGGSTVGIDLVCPVNGGQSEFAQSGSSSILTLLGTTGFIDADGTYHANCLVSFMGNTTVDLSTIIATLSFNDLISSGAKLKATNTTFEFEVAADELSNSALVLTGFSGTVDSTDTAKVLGGKTTDPGTGNNCTFANGMGSSRWTWSFPANLNWSDNSGAGNLIAVHK